MLFGFIIKINLLTKNNNYEKLVDFNNDEI